MSNRALLVLALLTACKAPPPDAADEFNDAAVYVLSNFDGDEAHLARAVRMLEEQLYTSLDLRADDSQSRALTPLGLTWDDVENIPHHADRDPADTIPVAVARLSEWQVPPQSMLPLLADQRQIEPYSPNHYDRSFLDGTDVCWRERGCDILLTFNELTKENVLMNVPYELHKWYRWIDLALPDPDDADAEPEDEPRWAFISRSWQPGSFTGESGSATLHQSYSMELWVPRDGRGYVGDDATRDDSTGGGTLRLMSTWAETEFKGIDVGENAIIGTTRKGMDDIFEAQDDYIAEHPED